MSQLAGAADSTTLPFLIMFGPDKCEDKKQIHLIVQMHLTNGSVVEHRLRAPPVPEQFAPPLSKARDINRVRETTLYTALITRNLTVEILVDTKLVRTANLHSPEDFDPPLPD